MFVNVGHFKTKEPPWTHVFFGLWDVKNIDFHESYCLFYHPMYLSLITFNWHTLDIQSHTIYKLYLYGHKQNPKTSIKMKYTGWKWSPTIVHKICHMARTLIILFSKVHIFIKWSSNYLSDIDKWAMYNWVANIWSGEGSNVLHMCVCSQGVEKT